MSEHVWSNPITQLVAMAIKRNRTQYAKWLEAIDCLMIEEDLPEYREAFEVPIDYGRTKAKCYVLADMMEIYYDDIRPDIDTPFDRVLSEGFSEVNFMEIAAYYFSCEARKETKCS